MTIVIVGGGVIGTMHALLAHRAGHDVVQLERDAGPRSASVRNFGLVWVSGRADGEELDGAIRARELWEDLAGDVPGVGFRPEGSLTIALTEAELDVMRAFAGTATARERSIVLVDTDEVRQRNPVIRGEVHGGLWCDRDAIVEPRQVLGAVRAFLEPQGRYRFVTGCDVRAVKSREVVDQAGTRYGGDAVVVCTGAEQGGPTPTDGAPLRRVRLQMMETAPFPDRLPTSIADADSMRYYPAYACAPLNRLGPQTDVAAANDMQLLLVQRAAGGLTIGDTHSYDEPFDFGLDEAPYDYLKARAEQVLGRPIPPVVRRWEGVYSQCTDGRLCYRAEVEAGVWYVTGVGGRGMTCSPAVAEATLRQAGIT